MPETAFAGKAVSGKGWRKVGSENQKLFDKQEENDG